MDKQHTAYASLSHIRETRRCVEEHLAGVAVWTINALRRRKNAVPLRSVTHGHITEEAKRRGGVACAHNAKPALQEGMCWEGSAVSFLAHESTGTAPATT